MAKRKIECLVIPPDADGEFFAHMEEVLETYDPAAPVVCMDEQPVQLIGETRVPIAATKTHGKRVDYEYDRKGTASIFLFAEPLSGFRQATARERRTKDDWANCKRKLPSGPRRQMPINGVSTGNSALRRPARN